jgi:hypothetical protein
MANTKISQFNSWSGTAADLRWFLMNNSGETETFKFSGYTSQLVPGTGANSYKTLNATSAASAQGIAIGLNADTKSGANCIVIGNGAVTNANNPADDIVIGTAANTQSGAGGIAIGKNARAGGIIRKAVAIGQDVQATGTGIIVGWSATANGDGACAFGILNTASAESSTAVGVLANCTGVHAVAIGRDVNATGLRSIAIAPNTTVSRTNSCAVGGNAQTINNGERQAIFGGVSNTISSTSNQNTIINGNSCGITGSYSAATLIGLTSYLATRSNAVFVENLVVTDYANLDFADDTAAAAGGVVLGQLYHNSGAMRVRIV